MMSRDHGPPSYLSCASLARELDMSETTIHEMVRRGVLPRPVKLSSGCVRWCWADVQRALACYRPSMRTPPLRPIRSSREGNATSAQ